jgi:Mg2+ and Co2+ transporter CorA
MGTPNVEIATDRSAPADVPELRWISESGVESRGIGELGALLERDDGFIWLDLPSCDNEATRLLSDVFGFHPHAIRDCREKRRIPKIHTYSDCAFVILHDLDFEEGGWGHLVELDQFVGERYLVTVHGPLSPHVGVDAARRQTRATLRRMEAGTFSPSTPAQLGHGLISILTLHLEELVATIADRVAARERSIVRGEEGHPQEVVEQLFRLRHQLLLIRTAAGLSREVFAGRAAVARSSVSSKRLALIEDIIDQYQRLKSLCDTERGFLDQVLEFHQARVVTKMNLAMERLALIAAVLLPVTAISSIYGMNVIVNDRTDFLHAGGVLVLMGTIIALMLRWTKRQGWW